MSSQVSTSQGVGKASEAPQAGMGGGGSAAARTDLESCRMVNCTVGKLPFGKIPLGSCRLEKNLWESTQHQSHSLHYSRSTTLGC